jgi:broad specificity phosphatase PhoE
LGQSDPPLASVGVQQARQLARALDSVSFDLIISSDLKRCLSTAQLIAREAAVRQGQDAMDIKADPRLREIDCGLWEGLTLEEAAIRYPDEHSERERDPMRWRFTGGESFLDLRERVFPALWEAADSGVGNVLIVGHLGVNRVILCDLQGLPLEDLFSIKLEYCSVAILGVTGPRGAGRRIEVLASPLSD